MTLGKIIHDKGLRKEWVIDKTGIPRNRFYCDINKLHKFSDDEIKKLAEVIGIDESILFDLAIKKTK